MPGDATYIREFKAFTGGELTADDLPRLEDELYGSNDRAAAVMLASFTEVALQTFLKGHIRPTYSAENMRLLFEFSGVLGTFGAKITIAYAFNWIGPETRHDLDLIRLMRNEFAHARRSFGFTDAPVAAVCKNLQAPDWPGAFIPMGSLARAMDLPAEASDRKHPRTRYRMACHTISHRLLSGIGDLR